MNGSPPPLCLDIFSDPICPWCYIGLKRLDEALADWQGAVETTWRCFMLNPDMPPEGMDRRLYLERKFGGPEGADRVYKAIETAATQAGLSVDFTRIQRTPSTIKAHQALRAAQDYGAGDRFIRALFQAYFEQGQDIGQTDVLTSLWAQADLDIHTLESVFDGQRHLDTLMAEQNEARARGISGVPFFVVGGTYALSGAQNKSVFHQVFRLIQNDTAQNNPVQNKEKETA